MSSYQTNQVDPGDSATDLTSPVHDQADDHTHASAAESAAAPIPAAGIDDEHMGNGNGNGIFPGQTADEQNLEVDVCRNTCSIFSYAPTFPYEKLTTTCRTTSRATQPLVVTRLSALRVSILDHCN
jgi:hypothetical protein